MADIGDTETLVVQGSVTLDDMSVGSGYGTLCINGKKVTQLIIHGKVVSSISKDEVVLWSSGGQSTVFFGDIKREWHVGGQVIQGSVTLNDMDTNVAFGDIKRVWYDPNANLYDSSVTDIGGYLRYSNHVFNTGDISGNRVTYFLASPNTIYKVTMKMDTRFRIWSYNGVPVTNTTISNYAIHSLDVNDTTSQGGSVQTLSITTGSGDDRVFIDYWSSDTNAMDYQILRDSIVAEKV